MILYKKDFKLPYTFGFCDENKFCVFLLTKEILQKMGKIFKQTKAKE